MSSDSFTIPKKKRQDSTPGSALLPAQQDGQAAQARPNRKVLPTRASRISDARDTPEWEAMSKLISQFYARADAAPFRDPVDWKGLGLYDYPRAIRKPMDIGVVKRRVMEGKYKTVFEAAEDMRLVWKNCMKYNPGGTEFHKLGQKLSTKFEEKYAKLCKKHGGSPPAPSRGYPWGQPCAKSASQEVLGFRSWLIHHWIALDE